MIRLSLLCLPGAKALLHASNSLEECDMPHIALVGKLKKRKIEFTDYETEIGEEMHDASKADKALEKI